MSTRQKNTIAVIIPTHKRLISLELAIKSVINQTKQVNEIIIVDDVGDLKVELLVNKYKENGTIYIKNTEKQGAAISRNIGVDYAKSELIAFLDDDDVWFLNKIEKQIPYFLDKTIGLVYSPMLLVFPDLRIEYKTSPCKKSISLPEILMENKIGGTISVIIRRNWFLSVGGFDPLYKAREEYDLWIRLIQNNNYSVKYCDVLSCRVTNIISSSNRISCNINNYIDALDLLNRKFRVDIDKYLDNKEKTYRKSLQANFLASQAMKVGDKMSGIKYFINSFITTPSLGTFIKVLLSFFGWKFMVLIRSKVKQNR